VRVVEAPRQGGLVGDQLAVGVAVFGIGQDLGLEDLDRHLAIVERVMGKVHNARRAPAEFAGDLVFLDSDFSCLFH
jgi:hypothetical protein